MKKNHDIIAALTDAYWKELETVQNYLANSVNLDGVRAEEIKKALAADVAEELTHAQQLASRIKVLGGQVPGSKEFKARQKGLQPPKDTTDVLSVIEGVLEAEEDAIVGYNRLIKLCDGRDYVTQDLAVTLLADEEGHRQLFHSFMKEYKKR
ncbi:MAG TPA: ferritin-like domain-containing protein [Kiritimatiellia bacterium]|nr:ferritin-like domain-containing protein [Kiritimatiellia bacterium]HMO98896.1 ferritin-like domain-containing protein [Kiritimatiellia bacterium]HMP96828.1 ferritin-like domain-containing protein [Kiritimatiellia bacterium]